VLVEDVEFGAANGHHELGVVQRDVGCGLLVPGCGYDALRVLGPRRVYGFNVSKTSCVGLVCMPVAKAFLYGGSRAESVEDLVA
jgi:hypothetical protein